MKAYFSCYMLAETSADGSHSMSQALDKTPSWAHWRVVCAPYSTWNVPFAKDSLARIVT